MSRSTKTLLLVLSCLTLCASCKRAQEGRPGGPAVVVVDQDAGSRPSGPLATEVEPNDKLPQAQPVTPPVTVEGSLSGPKDLDGYRLTIAGPDRASARIELLPKVGVDVAVDLLDQTGARLTGANDVKASEPEILPMVSLSPGPYVIRVRSGLSGKDAAAAPAGGYSLSIRLSPIDPNAEQEPNDKVALATPIALGATLSGQLASRRDEDHFRLDLAAGSGTDAGAAGPPPSSVRIDLSGLDDVALELEVRDSIGSKLVSAKAGKGESVTLRNVAVRAAEPFYDVIVRGSGRNLEGRYTIRVQPESLSGGPSEAEPNDEHTRATPLLPGPQTSGFLGPRDQDFYKLSFTTPQILRIESSCPERTNIKLAIHAGSGTELYHIDDAGRQEPEIIADAWVPAGDSYLKVYAGKGESNADQAYRLDLRATPDDGSWEHEPNAGPERASTWGAGRPTMKGMIHPKGDVDVFRLPAGPPGSRGVNVSARGIDRVDLVLEIRGEDGAVLARSQPGAAGERTVKAPMDAQKALFVAVRDEKGKGSNPRDAYELRVGFE